MQYKWLENKGSKEIIVFFSGWAVDYRPFLTIKSQNYDVLFIYDYKNLNIEIDFTKIVKNYSKINIIGWSMGVFVANYVFSSINIPINKAVAINGSLFPVSDKYGIPEKIFDGTFENLSDRNLHKFYKRMCRLKDIEKYFFENLPQGTIQSQKEELAFLKEISRTNIKEKNIFTHSIIGTLDAIYPLQNLINYWEKYLTPTILDIPHFPFLNIKYFDELLQTTPKF